MLTFCEISFKCEDCVIGGLYHSYHDVEHFIAQNCYNCTSDKRCTSDCGNSVVIYCDTEEELKAFCGFNK